MGEEDNKKEFPSGNKTPDDKEEIVVEEAIDGNDVLFQEKIKKLREKLKKYQEERDEYLAGWQRAKADFINSRKDEEKRREEFLKFSNRLIISDTLTVLDSFDLAFAHCESLKEFQKEETEKLLKGFYLIKAQLNDILKKYGLSVIKSMGEKFNPELHEAVAEIESDKESGTIIEEIQKGYKLQGKVLRAAKVKIAK